MSTSSPLATPDGEQFDALAAAAETTDMAVLPSPTTDHVNDDENADDLITAQDLAHLTGDGGPEVNGWDSPPTNTPGPAATSAPDGIDAPVSKAVVFPLVAVALAAVAFVAYSILTASPSVRPDTVALIDRTTTTAEPTTTTTEPPLEFGVGRVGVDVAEQAARLCARDQFSIARAEAPSLATYNDVMPVTKDGRDAWEASPDHVTLRTLVPALVGCLTTADGGEIDRCPTTGYVISRRSVTWTYRVLQTVDGLEVGAASGTATEVRDCEELVTEAGGEDYGSWSPLPRELIDSVADVYTGAPHPSEACGVEAAPVSSDDEATEAPVPTEGLSLHAMFADVSDVDVSLPEGWMATAERPVEVVLCLERVEQQVDELAPEPAADPQPEPDAEAAPDAQPEPEAQPDPEAQPEPEADVVAPSCETTIDVTAMSRDGSFVGAWQYRSAGCAEDGQPAVPTTDWWLNVVGPELGYELEVEESSDGE